MAFVLHAFDTREKLAEALAGEIAHQLGQAIAAHGEAFLAVSGGSTPGALFEKLSQADLPWHSITVVPVDERCVPTDHERSNAKLILAKLLKGRAAFAHFIPLHDGDNVEQSATSVAAKIPANFDVVVLGMGTDGHTASFFPDAKELQQVTDPKTPFAVSAIHAPSAGEPRITLTLPHLTNARFLAVHIEGSEKKKVFDEAVMAGDADTLPIRHILRAKSSEPNIYWAP